MFVKIEFATLNLSAVPSPSAVAAAVAELDASGVGDDTATNLGGKAVVDTHGLRTTWMPHFHKLCGAPQ